MLLQNWIAAVRQALARTEETKPQFRSPQSAAREYDVARFCARSQNCGASPYFPHDGDVDKDVFPAGGVAAGQRAGEALGCPTQPAKKLSQPRARVARGQG